jgi:uncharacterized protein (UPF0335 family)
MSEPDDFNVNADVEELSLKFSQSLLSLLVAKKDIDGSIKDLKAEAKSNGVNTSLIASTVTAIIKDMKTKEEVIEEAEVYAGMMTGDGDCARKISNLAT